MALVIEISNPFEPLRDTRQSEAPAGITLLEWLEQRFPGFKKFARPTLCIINGKPVFQKDWSTRKIEDREVVNFVALPTGLDPITWLWIAVIALTATTVVLALTMKQNLPNVGQTPEADPVYSLKGQRNQIRLGEPIEVPYGRCRMWPSYAAMPYNKYENNQQWLYQLFCLGQGRFSIESKNIEDTPVESFADVEVEICPPGVPVTLFPDNVVTSIEAQNIELFGPNEPESGGEYIEDSPGDVDFDIAPTSHYAASAAGPFVANPAHTETNKIELDVSFPRGLFVQNDNGTLANMTVTALFEAREIDDDGEPVGDWFTIANFSKTLATVTPQRFTVECPVDLGRYEVRGRRTNNKNTDARSGNTLHWEAMRAFLPSTRDYGNVTMVAVKARASNNLNDNAASRFNIVGVRWLPSWNVATQSWNDAAPTRSLVWAFVDIFRSVYGGRLADEFLDLDYLAALNTTFTEREEHFDWVFDQRLTVWDAARTAAMVGRAIPMLNGSRVTMVRDEIKTTPFAIFNPENIVKGSFRRELKLSSVDAKDGLVVTYVDPTTWKEETVDCFLPGEDGNDPETVKLNGVTSRTHAYRWGMWKRAAARYRRDQVTFRTGLEGHIPSFGDAIGVCHDVPRWGKGGFVTAVNGAGTGLTLSEPVTFIPATNHKIMLRKKNGEATLPLAVTAGADAFHVVLSAPVDPDEFAFDPKKEPPIFNFGVESFFDKMCVVSSLAPADNDEVEVVATAYRPEPHSFDEYIPPAPGNTHGNLPPRPALPSVSGLVVNRSPDIPNEVIASWIPTAGAKYYVVQLSYDGTSYETLSDYVEATNFRFSVLPRYIYVRVAAVTTGAGAWAYWTGDAPVERTNIVIDNGVDPDPVTGLTVFSGIEELILTWTNPANTPVKAIHFYEAVGLHTDEPPPDMPAVATIYVPQISGAATGFYFRRNLPDGSKRTYWAKAEGVNGRFSTISAPASGTVVVWPVVDDITQQIEGLDTKIENRVVRSATAPTSPQLYQVWYDTANGNRPKMWNGSNWIDTSDARIVVLETFVNHPTTGLTATRAEVFSGATTWAAGDAALATSISSVSAAAAAAQSTANSAVTNAAAAQSTANGAASAASAAQTTANTAVTNAAGAQTTANAAVTSAAAAQTSANGAQSTANTAVTAASTAQGTANAAVTSASNAQAGVNSLAAEYVLIVTTAGGGVSRMAGFRITNQGGAGGSSDFILQADKVAIVNSSGANQKAPFAVVGGVVYLDMAMIRNATITNAMIDSVIADKISAGTLAAMILTAAKTATDSAFFNPAHGTGSTFPAFSALQGENNSSHGINGTEYQSLVTIYGWATGSGYATNRFGRSNIAFSAHAGSSFSLGSTGDYADLYIAFRINGGSWTRCASGSRNNFYSGGGAHTSGAAIISGLGSTDVVEFAVELVTPTTRTFQHSDLHVLWGNL